MNDGDDNSDSSEESIVNEIPTIELVKRLAELKDSCENFETQSSKKLMNECQGSVQASTSNKGIKRSRNRRKFTIPRKRQKHEDSSQLDNCSQTENETEDEDLFTNYSSMSDDSDEPELKIVLKKPKKRIQEPITVPKDLMDLIVKSGIDDNLEEKAKKRKLSATHVKNIIKQIITDENVLQMVKNYATDKPLTNYEPNRTRAREKERKEQLAKQMQENGEAATALFKDPLIANNSLMPETRALISTEFPEEDDDEEYHPDLDELAFSDEESNVSILSKFGSPCLSATPSSVKSTPQSGFSKTQRQPISVPATINGLKAAQRTLDFSKTTIELIGNRTRSKYPMTDTPIEYLETQFRPPDITPDMYGGEEIDEDWKMFLNDFLQPQENLDKDNEDDPQRDPEYNIGHYAAEEVSSNILDLQEEMRVDKSVEITKRECKGLLHDYFEFFNDHFEEPIHLPESKSDETNYYQNSSESHQCSFSNLNNDPLFNDVMGVKIDSFQSTVCQPKEVSPELLEEEKAPYILVEYKISHFSPEHIRVLEYQLALHTQMLTTTILNSEQKESMAFMARGATNMLYDLKICGDESKGPIADLPTLYHPPNLDPAIATVELFLQERDKQPYKDEMIFRTERNRRKKRDTESSEENIESKKILFFKNDNRRLEKYPPWLMDIYMSSEAFPFPEYLPSGIFHGNFYTIRRVYKNSEYWLMCHYLVEKHPELLNRPMNSNPMTAAVQTTCLKLTKKKLIYAYDKNISRHICCLLCSNKTLNVYKHNPIVILLTEGRFSMPRAIFESQYRGYPCKLVEVASRLLPFPFKAEVQKRNEFNFNRKSLPTIRSVGESNEAIYIVQKSNGMLQIILPPSLGPIPIKCVSESDLVGSTLEEQLRNLNPSFRVPLNTSQSLLPQMVSLNPNNQSINSPQMLSTFSPNLNPSLPVLIPVSNGVDNLTGLSFPSPIIIRPPPAATINPSSYLPKLLPAPSTSTISNPKVILPPPPLEIPLHNDFLPQEPLAECPQELNIKASASTDSTPNKMLLEFENLPSMSPFHDPKVMTPVKTTTDVIYQAMKTNFLEDSLSEIGSSPRATPPRQSCPTFKSLSPFIRSSPYALNTPNKSLQSTCNRVNSSSTTKNKSGPTLLEIGSMSSTPVTNISQKLMQKSSEDKMCSNNTGIENVHLSLNQDNSYVTQLVSNSVEKCSLLDESTSPLKQSRASQRIKEKKNNKKSELESDSSLKDQSNSIKVNDASSSMENVIIVSEKNSKKPPRTEKKKTTRLSLRLRNKAKKPKSKSSPTKKQTESTHLSSSSCETIEKSPEKIPPKSPFRAASSCSNDSNGLVSCPSLFSIFTPYKNDSSGDKSSPAKNAAQSQPTKENLIKVSPLITKKTSNSNSISKNEKRTPDKKTSKKGTCEKMTQKKNQKPSISAANEVVPFHEELVVANYIKMARKAFSGPDFGRILTLLQKFTSSESQDAAREHYQDISKILSPFPQLQHDFVLLMNLEQASQVGKRSQFMIMDDFRSLVKDLVSLGACKECEIISLLADLKEILGVASSTSKEALIALTPILKTSHREKASKVVQKYFTFAVRKKRLQLTPRKSDSIKCSDIPQILPKNVEKSLSDLSSEDPNTSRSSDPQLSVRENLQNFENLHKVNSTNKTQISSRSASEGATSSYFPTSENDNNNRLEPVREQGMSVDDIKSNLFKSPDKPAKKRPDKTALKENEHMKSSNFKKNSKTKKRGITDNSNKAVQLKIRNKDEKKKVKKKSLKKSSKKVSSEKKKKEKVDWTEDEDLILINFLQQNGLDAKALNTLCSQFISKTVQQVEKRLTLIVEMLSES